MQKYYTAVGRFERKGRMGDMTCPMVIINNREYALDIQEMILWAALNWQIMDAGSLENAYSAKLKASGIRPQRSISACMRRLMQRGLVVEGCGETDEDALYALLSGLYVVPISDSLLLRLPGSCFARTGAAQTNGGFIVCPVRHSYPRQN